MNRNHKFLTPMQSVFLQARVNGGVYKDSPQRIVWPWPNSTWLELRLKKVREGKKEGMKP